MKDENGAGFFGAMGQTIKGCVKMLLQSHCVRYDNSCKRKPLVILGNGPSLKETINKHIDRLHESDTMAVNFAANAPEFKLLKPDYYILADPHFFDNPADPNVDRLISNIQKSDWRMTIFLPFGARRRCSLKNTEWLTVEYYNAIGVEGFRWFTDVAYKSRMAMPRPRNVLIPAIMTGIGMGYKEIYLTGADHSWTKTLSVEDDNRVVSIQPHFYKEDEREVRRISAEYLKHKLHSILYSFYLAFRSYHVIEDYASRKGISIYNATPGSFIDAFERKSL